MLHFWCWEDPRYPPPPDVISGRSLSIFSKYLSKSRKQINVLIIIGHSRVDANSDVYYNILFLDSPEHILGRCVTINSPPIETVKYH